MLVSETVYIIFASQANESGKLSIVRRSFMLCLAPKYHPLVWCYSASLIREGHQTMGGIIPICHNIYLLTSEEE